MDTPLFVIVIATGTVVLVTRFRVFVQGRGLDPRARTAAVHHPSRGGGALPSVGAIPMGRPLRLAMRHVALLPCVLSALVLAGCIPNAVRYYRPSVAGGTIIKGYCVPTKRAVEFDLPSHEGKLRISTWAHRGKGRHMNFVYLFFSSKTRAWQAFHFTSTNFRIREPGKHLLIDASSVLAYKKDSTSELTTETYRAQPDRRGPDSFSIQVKFAKPLPDRFELLSPPIVIDGKQVDFPAIRFQRSTWVGISPFNC